MAKKKNWFSLVKRLFIWDTYFIQDKKDKRRKWIFGRLKNKRLPSVKTSPLSKETTLTSEVEEEQSKHALNVAIASAAAAEAAITAAKVAVEVVRIQSSQKFAVKTEEELQDVEIRHDGSQSTYSFRREIEHSAAIKIQTAFRGYLAKKALRALKGIVKLQAIIRGRAVRRQAMSTLKCLQSIVSIQSQVCARRLQMVEGKCNCDENEEIHDSRDKIIRMDSNSERRWDDSILLKEDLVASCISKKEAALKRERIKEYYSFNHRRSAETERSKVKGRWRYWMEQWVDTQLSKSKELEDLDSVFSSNSRGGDECGKKQLMLRNNQRQNHVEGIDSPKLASRKSFPHRRQGSEGEDHSFPNSPSIPTYMAATKSAQAKVRSTSSPRVRIGGGNLDTNSDSYSPCKKKLSIATSINNEVLNNNGRMGKLISNQQRSPSLKGLSRPIKSSPITKDLSMNSDSSVPNWAQQCSFK